MSISNISLAVKLDGNETKLTLSDLMERIGYKNVTPDELVLSITQDNLSLRVSTSPTEEYYPGIYVDGQDTKVNTNYYLGNFELPNASYPNSFTARLYAGNEKFETDSPICMVRHATDETSLEEYINHYENNSQKNRPLTKNIYVDKTIARTNHWAGACEEDLPEHMEDE